MIYNDCKRRIYTQVTIREEKNTEKGKHIILLKLFLLKLYRFLKLFLLCRQHADGFVGTNAHMKTSNKRAIMLIRNANKKWQFGFELATHSLCDGALHHCAI